MPPAGGKARTDYVEGFDKGEDDRRWGTERYRYVEPQKVQPGGAWPFPGGNR
jgi:hypothetical protein